MHLHLFGWVRAKEVERQLFGRVDVAGEPAVIVAGAQDDRHAGMDLGGEFVRVGGDDGEGLQPVVDLAGGSLRFLPCIPETGKAKSWPLARSKR